jgi:hypothetical protein
MEFVLRDAAGPDGEFIANLGHPESVVVDHPFITARDAGSAAGCGRAIVAVLKDDRRRSGW